MMHGLLVLARSCCVMVQEGMSASLWRGTARAARWLRTTLSRRRAASFSWCADSLSLLCSCVS